MDIKSWAKTAIIASLGGGFASMFTAAMDPAKYSFPKDFGSGKLWPFFFQGAGLVFVGMILKSPFGQHMMSSFRQSQAQMKEDREAIDTVKQELKGVAQSSQTLPTADSKPSVPQAPAPAVPGVVVKPGSTDAPKK